MAQKKAVTKNVKKSTTQVQVAKKVTKKVAPKKTGKTQVNSKDKKTKTSVDKNVRKIQRQANGSTTIVLPAELLRELGWKPKLNVTVKKRGDGILIEKVQKK